MTIIAVKKAVRVKRLLVILALCSGALWAEALVYFGAGGIATTEVFTVKNPGQTEQERSTLFTAGQLKAGYGDIRAYAVEVNLGYGRYDKNIFSYKDSDYVYFDLSMIKAFDFGIGFYPFFKLGFGAGELGLSRTLANSISSGSFFGGLGAYVPLGYGFDLELSVIYRNKNWEGLDMIGDEVKSDSYLFEPYFGLNYRF